MPLHETGSRPRAPHGGGPYTRHATAPLRRRTRHRPRHARAGPGTDSTARKA